MLTYIAGMLLFEMGRLSSECGTDSKAAERLNLEVRTGAGRIYYWCPGSGGDGIAVMVFGPGTRKGFWWCSVHGSW